jgi:hypothetical protein
MEVEDKWKFEDRRGMSSGGKTIVGGGIIGIVFYYWIFGGENAQMFTNIWNNEPRTKLYWTKRP